MAEFSIVTLENSFLAEPDELSILRPGLWPSEASVAYELDGRQVVEGKCMRAAWFRSMGYDKDGCINPGMAMKWDLGNSAEKFSVERWKKMGIYKANNVKFFDRDLSISGELDCVVKNPETDGLVGVEVKSFYGHYANQELCGAKKPPKPGAPKADNFLQAAIYKIKYLEQLEQYRLYYLERGDGHRVEFEVGAEPDGDDFKLFHRQIEGPYWNTFSPEKVYKPFTINGIYARCKELKQRLLDRDLPPKDFMAVWDDDMADWAWSNGRVAKTKYEKFKNGKEELGDWQCSYCDHREACRNADV